MAKTKTRKRVAVKRVSRRRATASTYDYIAVDALPPARVTEPAATCAQCGHPFTLVPQVEGGSLCLPCYRARHGYR